MKTNQTSWQLRVVIGLVAVCLLGGMIIILTSLDDVEPGAPAGRVWSPEHGHYH